jgi:hypothetical protein
MMSLSPFAIAGHLPALILYLHRVRSIETPHTWIFHGA